MRTIGSKAPTFSLTDRRGRVTKLADLNGEFVVVYFYPKDNTPGCTLEAIEFSSRLAKFKRLKTDVVGISGGDDQSKSRFCAEHGLTVSLLSDPTFHVARAYGVYGTKSFMGRKFQGIKRTTFVLDRSRKIIEIYNNVRPKGHAEDVLQFLYAQREVGKHSSEAHGKG